MAVGPVPSLRAWLYRTPESHVDKTIPGDEEQEGLLQHTEGKESRQWPRLRAQCFSGQGSFAFLHCSNDRVKLFQPRWFQGIQMAYILHLSCPLHQQRHKQDSCYHLVVDPPTRMNTRMALDTASAVIQEGLRPHSLQLRKVNGCREMMQPPRGAGWSPKGLSVLPHSY